MKSIQVTVRVFLLMLGVSLLLSACGQEQPPYIPPAPQPNFNPQFQNPQQFQGQGGAHWNGPYGGGQVQWQNGGYVYPQPYPYPQGGGFVQWNGPHSGGTVQWQR
jgi:hypothetical protein